MTRVIIHPGFHKTGTTSLQQFLDLNANALAPHVRVIMKPQMEDVAKCARDCSNHAGFGSFLLGPIRRATFRRQFADLLVRSPLEQGQILLISCEALVGRMPGRDNVKAFDAAAGLAKDMAHVAERHFGSDLDLTFFYTTRSAKSWMKSAYSHLLHQSRFTLSEAEFLAKYKRAGNLDEITHAITKVAAPHRLITSALEETASQPFGPATDLLKLLELPEEVIKNLEAARHLNRKLTNAELDKLKRINSKDVDETELSLMKRRFIRKQRKRAQRRQNDTH